MIEQATIKLLEYCARNDWSGYDPYDGLNSPVFAGLLRHRSKLARLILIQCMKHSPVNCRPFLRVPKESNPKGLALFVSALLKLSHAGVCVGRDTIVLLLNRLCASKAPGCPHFCWGYNFDWQARHFLACKGTPNIICTTFVGNAFLDAYSRYHDRFYLDIAMSAGHFLLYGLQRTQDNHGICFSYTPSDFEQVHNANLLGSTFLARLHQMTAEEIFLECSIAAARFSIARQRGDGSWRYGEGRKQTWIDNFHTGYNLVALHHLCRYTGRRDWWENIRRGFDFYRSHFFTREGLPRYYHNRLYPIDTHALAQSLVTLIELKHLNESNLDLALTVCQWAIRHMQNFQGYFYYQKGRLIKNRIPYMRWSQAWMLYALAHLREALIARDSNE
ncbi:MAG: hypothetical protein ACREOO_31205 [bacterium]